MRVVAGEPSDNTVQTAVNLALDAVARDER
jgi:hypothetical protein